MAQGRERNQGIAELVAEGEGEIPEQAPSTRPLASGGVVHLRAGLLPEGPDAAGFRYEAGGSPKRLPGIRRHPTQFPMVAQAMLYGGHVRVGLEDNLYLARGKLAPSNAALVEKAAEIIDVMGEDLATAADARQMLGLRQPT